MAEPFSIATGCLSLVKLSKHVVVTLSTTWTRYREAAKDAIEIIEEIETLKEVLDILQLVVSRCNSLGISAGIDRQINRAINKCEKVVQDIHDHVESTAGGGRWDKIKWSTNGHAKAQELLDNLRDRRETLECVRETLAVGLQIDIRDNIAELRAEAAHARQEAALIRNNTEHIVKLLDQKRRLQESPLREQDAESEELFDTLSEFISSCINSSGYNSPDASVLAQVHHYENDQLAESTIRLVSTSLGKEVERFMGESSSSAIANSKRTRQKQDARLDDRPLSPISQPVIAPNEGELVRLRDPRAIKLSSASRAKINPSRWEIYDERLRQIEASTTPQNLERFLKLGADPNPFLGSKRMSSLVCPAIHQAIKSGNTRCLEVLLKYGANTEVLFKDESPLKLAVRLGHLESTRLLLQEGASKSDVGAMNSAIKGDNSDLTRLLLEHGMAADQTSLKLAVSSNQPDVVDALLGRGIAPDNQVLEVAISKSISGVLHNLLSKALLLGKMLFRPARQIPELLKSVLQKLARATSLSVIQAALSMYKMMIQMMFDKVGSRDHVRRLMVKRGLLQHAISIQGRPQASSVNNSFCEARKEICEFILDQGIDVNAEASCAEDRHSPHSPLMCALKHQIVIREDKSCILEVVELLVVQNRCTVNEYHLQETPLHLASKQGYQGVADLLLDHGAAYNPRITSRDLEVLEASIRHNWTVTTATLIRKCPDFRYGFLREHSSGLLCTAVENTNEAMTLNLLNAGFKVDRISIRRAVDKDMTQVVSRMLYTIADDSTARQHLIVKGAPILRQAIRNGNSFIAQLLLHTGIRAGLATFTEAAEQGMTETMRGLVTNTLHYHRGEDEHTLRSTLEKCILMATNSKNKQMVHFIWCLQLDYQFPRPQHLIHHTIRSGNAEMTLFFLEDSNYYTFNLSLLEEVENTEMLLVLWGIAANGRVTRNDFPQEMIDRLPNLVQKVVRSREANLIELMFQAADRREQTTKLGFIALQLAFQDPTTPIDFKALIMNHRSNRNAAMIFYAETYRWRGVQELVGEGGDINLGIGDLPSNVSSCRLTGFPPIYHAILAQSIDALEDLIRNGAQVNGVFRTTRGIRVGARISDVTLWTPLHLAVMLFIDVALQGSRYCSEETFTRKYDKALGIVRFLVRKNADANRRVPLCVLSSSGKQKRQNLSAIGLAKAIFPKSFWQYYWSSSPRERTDLVRELEGRRYVYRTSRSHLP